MKKALETAVLDAAKEVSLVILDVDKLQEPMLNLLDAVAKLRLWEARNAG